MNKLKLKSMDPGSAEVLSRAQLKHVLVGVVGGTAPGDDGGAGGGSGSCAAGEHLYTCIVITNDCGTANGATCGTSVSSAEDRNLNYWARLGCGLATVSCSY